MGVRVLLKKSRCLREGRGERVRKEGEAHTVSGRSNVDLMYEFETCAISPEEWHIGSMANRNKRAAWGKENESSTVASRALCAFFKDKRSRRIERQQGGKRWKSSTRMEVKRNRFIISRRTGRWSLKGTRVPVILTLDRRLGVVSSPPGPGYMRRIKRFGRPSHTQVPHGSIQIYPHVEASSTLVPRSSLCICQATLIGFV